MLLKGNSHGIGTDTHSEGWWAQSGESWCVTILAERFLLPMSVSERNIIIFRSDLLQKYERKNLFLK